LSNRSHFHERRLTARHQISVPVKYRPAKSELAERLGESVDISEGGICFVTSALVKEGDILQVRFDMPEEVVAEPTTEWRCSGQVLKVESVGAHAQRVRMRFEHYEVRRPTGTTTVRIDVNAHRFGW
jgi:c-di-GMP-binding flagellar brake protein YcgR